MAEKKATKKAAPKKAAKKAATPKGMEAPVYDVSGKKAGSVALPESVFGAKWKPDLVHQVVTAFQANARTNTAFTKDRSEVSGGGRKPWRQKGTGRARHGSRRSPIWRGGGATHAPTKERDFSQKTSRKMRVTALMSALSQKLRDEEVLFVDSLGLSEPKTAAAKGILDGLAKVKGFEVLGESTTNIALIATPEKDENAQRSFNNFGNVEVVETRNLNALDVMKYKNVVIVGPKESVEFLAGKIK